MENTAIESPHRGRSRSIAYGTQLSSFSNNSSNEQHGSVHPADISTPKTKQEVLRAIDESKNQFIYEPGIDTVDDIFLHKTTPALISKETFIEDNRKLQELLTPNGAPEAVVVEKKIPRLSPLSLLRSVVSSTGQGAQDVLLPSKTKTKAGLTETSRISPIWTSSLKRMTAASCVVKLKAEKFRKLCEYADIVLSLFPVSKRVSQGTLRPPDEDYWLDDNGNADFSPTTEWICGPRRIQLMTSNDPAFGFRKTIDISTTVAVPNPENGELLFPIKLSELKDYACISLVGTNDPYGETVLIRRLRIRGFMPTVTLNMLREQQSANSQQTRTGVVKSGAPARSKVKSRIVNIKTSPSRRPLEATPSPPPGRRSPTRRSSPPKIVGQGAVSPVKAPARKPTRAKPTDAGKVPDIYSKMTKKALLADSRSFGRLPEMPDKQESKTPKLEIKYPGKPSADKKPGKRIAWPTEDAKPTRSAPKMPKSQSGKSAARSEVKPKRESRLSSYLAESERKNVASKAVVKKDGIDDVERMKRLDGLAKQDGKLRDIATIESSRHQAVSELKDSVALLSSMLTGETAGIEKGVKEEAFDEFLRLEEESGETGAEKNLDKVLSELERETRAAIAEEYPPVDHSPERMVVRKSPVGPEAFTIPKQMKTRDITATVTKKRKASPVHVDFYAKKNQILAKKQAEETAAASKKPKPKAKVAEIVPRTTTVTDIAADEGSPDSSLAIHSARSLYNAVKVGSSTRPTLPADAKAPASKQPKHVGGGQPLLPASYYADSFRRMEAQEKKRNERAAAAAFSKPAKSEHTVAVPGRAFGGSRALSIIRSAKIASIVKIVGEEEANKKSPYDTDAVLDQTVSKSPQAESYVTRGSLGSAKGKPGPSVKDDTSAVIVSGDIAPSSVSAFTDVAETVPDIHHSSELAGLDVPKPLLKPAVLVADPQHEPENEAVIVTQHESPPQSGEPQRRTPSPVGAPPRVSSPLQRSLSAKEQLGIDEAKEPATPASQELASRSLSPPGLDHLPAGKGEPEDLAQPPPLKEARMIGVKGLTAYKYDRNAKNRLSRVFFISAQFVEGGLAAALTSSDPATVLGYLFLEWGKKGQMRSRFRRRALTSIGRIVYGKLLSHGTLMRKDRNMLSAFQGGKGLGIDPGCCVTILFHDRPVELEFLSSKEARLFTCTILWLRRTAGAQPYKSMTSLFWVMLKRRLENAGNRQKKGTWQALIDAARSTSDAQEEPEHFEEDDIKPPAAALSLQGPSTAKPMLRSSDSSGGLTLPTSKKPLVGASGMSKPSAVASGQTLPISGDSAEFDIGPKPSDDAAPPPINGALLFKRGVHVFEYAHGSRNRQSRSLFLNADLVPGGLKGALNNANPARSLSLVRVEWGRPRDARSKYSKRMVSSIGRVVYGKLLSHGEQVKKSRSIFMALSPSRRNLMTTPVTGGVDPGCCVTLMFSENLLELEFDNSYEARLFACVLTYLRRTAKAQRYYSMASLFWVMIRRRIENAARRSGTGLVGALVVAANKTADQQEELEQMRTLKEVQQESIEVSDQGPHKIQEVRESRPESVEHVQSEAMLVGHVPKESELLESAALGMTSEVMSIEKEDGKSAQLPVVNKAVESAAPKQPVPKAQAAPQTVTQVSSTPIGDTQPTATIASTSSKMDANNVADEKVEPDKKGKVEATKVEPEKKESMVSKKKPTENVKEPTKNENEVKLTDSVEKVDSKEDSHKEKVQSVLKADPQKDLLDEEGKSVKKADAPKHAPKEQAEPVKKADAPKHVSKEQAESVKKADAPKHAPKEQAEPVKRADAPRHVSKEKAESVKKADAPKHAPKEQAEPIKKADAPKHVSKEQAESVKKADSPKHVSKEQAEPVKKVATKKVALAEAKPVQAVSSKKSEPTAKAPSTNKQSPEESALSRETNPVKAVDSGKTDAPRQPAPGKVKHREAEPVKDSLDMSAVDGKAITKVSQKRPVPGKAGKAARVADPKKQKLPVELPPPIEKAVLLEEGGCDVFKYDQGARNRQRRVVYLSAEFIEGGLEGAIRAEDPAKVLGFVSLEWGKPGQARSAYRKRKITSIGRVIYGSLLSHGSVMKRQRSVLLALSPSRSNLHSPKASPALGGLDAGCCVTLLFPDRPLELEFETSDEARLFACTLTWLRRTTKAQRHLSMVGLFWVMIRRRIESAARRENQPMGSALLQAARNAASVEPLPPLDFSEPAPATKGKAREESPLSRVSGPVAKNESTKAERRKQPAAIGSPLPRKSVTEKQPPAKEVTAKLVVADEVKPAAEKGADKEANLLGAASTASGQSSSSKDPKPKKKQEIVKTDPEKAGMTAREPLQIVTKKKATKEAPVDSGKALKSDKATAPEKTETGKEKPVTEHKTVVVPVLKEDEPAKNVKPIRSDAQEKTKDESVKKDTGAAKKDKIPSSPSKADQRSVEREKKNESVKHDTSKSVRVEAEPATVAKTDIVSDASKAEAVSELATKGTEDKRKVERVKEVMFPKGKKPKVRYEATPVELSPPVEKAVLLEEGGCDVFKYDQGARSRQRRVVYLSAEFIEGGLEGAIRAEDPAKVLGFVSLEWGKPGQARSAYRKRKITSIGRVIYGSLLSHGSVMKRQRSVLLALSPSRSNLHSPKASPALGGLDAGCCVTLLFPDRPLELEFETSDEARLFACTLTWLRRTTKAQRHFSMGGLFWVMIRRRIESAAQRQGQRVGVVLMEAANKATAGSGAPPV